MRAQVSCVTWLSDSTKKMLHVLCIPQAAKCEGLTAFCYDFSLVVWFCLIIVMVSAFVCLNTPETRIKQSNKYIYIHVLLYQFFFFCENCKQKLTQH